MEYMQAALRGDIAKVADLSFDCIMCGLCAVRCPSEIVQYHIGILCRRLYGSHLAPRAEHLEVRVKEISEGIHDAGLDKLTGCDIEELKRLYDNREIEADDGGGD